MTYFITKDSGERATFDSGMQRDTEAGKPRFDLLLPANVPYAEQFLTRVASLMARGAEKYEDRNWEKADSEAELARMRSSAFRHFMQWITGETDEDHSAAVVFNLLAHETTAAKIAAGEISVEWRDPATPTLATVADLHAHFGGSGYVVEGIVDEREALIEFACWLSEQVELDVDSPDHAVDEFLGERAA